MEKVSKEIHNICVINTKIRKSEEKNSKSLKIRWFSHQFFETWKSLHINIHVNKSPLNKKLTKSHFCTEKRNMCSNFLIAEVEVL